MRRMLFICVTQGGTPTLGQRHAIPRVTLKPGSVR